MKDLSLLYTGSVKNIWGQTAKPPYIFEYSDSYSVFDWGRMPDTLANKGESLAAMADFFFKTFGDPGFWKKYHPNTEFAAEPAIASLLQNLRTHGLQHHSRGLVDADLQTLTPGRLSNYLMVEPVDVYWPAARKTNGTLFQDYSAYQKKPVKALVPLEVIFRFGCPAGSSLLKRTKDAAYCRAIGLDAPPKIGDRFHLPVIEYSTKLESTDRYIPYDEARNLACLNVSEMQKLHAISALLAYGLQTIFAELDVELWDGKFEFAFAADLDSNGDRDFMLVDSIGPDELRLTYKNIQLSKESLRALYRDTPWFAATEQAKTIAVERGESDWKKICRDELRTPPPALPPETLHKAAMIYKSLCRALQKSRDLDVFPDAWTLDRLAHEWNDGEPAT